MVATCAITLTDAPSQAANRMGLVVTLLHTMCNSSDQNNPLAQHHDGQ